MQKVGILTFHFAYNYGAMLQAYALQTFLNEEEICNANILDYRPIYIDRSYHHRIANVIFAPRKFIKDCLHKSADNAFDYFLKTHIKPMRFNRRRFNDEFDVLIVGSDQVWNEFVTNRNEMYLGSFISNSSIRLISYAASIILDISSDNWKKVLKKRLTRFCDISVREEKDAVILSELLKRDVKHVVDPTLLLNRTRWEELERKPKDFCGDYILVYLLNIDSQNVGTVRKYHDGVTKLVGIHPTNIKMNCVDITLENIGPNEFLWLIHNARMVITDSFHATVFSLVFRKTILNCSSGKKNMRILSLYEMAGISLDNFGRQISFNNNALDHIQKYVDSSKEWMKESLLRCDNESFT